MRIIPLTDGIDLTMTPPSGVYRFKIVEETNENTVAAYARAATPAMQVTAFGVLYRDDIRVRRSAWNHWMVEVPYGTRKSELGEWTWDFDTTGGTVHITQAKEELRRYASSGSAPNQLGAIAVDGDEVKGTEIVVPAMKINVTYRHPLGIMTLARAKALNDLTGKTNSDTFLTFSPGEVLFLGARGSDGTEAEASVSYQFAMAANATGQTIGSIAGVAKRGWEVAWIRFEDTITSDQSTRVAKHVYIDRVYDEVAMASALGFGG